MGNANSQRSGDLPPSQGGKYAGFGSTPEPSYGSSESSSHPSFNLSSHSAPTLQELQSNPLGALSKGWGLFSSAVSSASREITETVVKPGMSRAQEIAQGQGGNDEWRNYLAGIGSNAKEASAWLGQRAGEGLEGLSGAAKDRGLDLDEHLQKMGLGPTQRPGYEGYGQVGRDGEGSGGREDNFFDSWDDQPAAKPAATPVSASAPAASASQGKTPAAKKGDGWNDDEWNDF
jgi:ADP-ribosylation factor GTPase-activating protein 1